MNSRRIAYIICCAAGLLYGCHHHHEHEHKHEHEHHESNLIAFHDEQAEKVDFALDTCHIAPIGKVIKTVAQIMPSQGDEQLVVAKSDGLVLFSGEAVVSGKSVRTGQLLCQVEGDAVQGSSLTVRIQEAASEYERARTNYERKKELASDKIVSESQLQQAKSEFEKAKAVYDNLRGNFSSGRQSVKSPMTGFVKQVFVSNGQYVQAGQPILSVSKNQNLFIKAEVQSKHYADLANLTDVNFSLRGKNATYSLSELDGKMLSYGKSADMDNAMIPVVFQVSNKGDLVPGTFVDAYLKTLSSRQAISVPKEAVVEEMGAYFIFVYSKPEMYEKRPVQIGSNDGRTIEITDGLAEGEVYVSKGAIYVKLAQSAGALDAHSGHVH